MQVFERRLQKIKTPAFVRAFFIKWRVHLAILTPSSPGTTFAASELDFQVRDVTGYFLTAIDTPKSCFDIWRSSASFLTHSSSATVSFEVVEPLANLRTQMSPDLFTITKQDKQVRFKEPCSFHTKKPLSRLMRDKKIKQNGLLVLVSSTPCSAYTPNLSSS